MLKYDSGQNVYLVSLQDNRTRSVMLSSLTFYFRRGYSWCCVVITFWQYHFHWHTSGPWIKSCFISHSSISVWKDFIHGILLSCWAKWGFVIGQKFTALSVKFNGNLFSSETVQTRMRYWYIYSIFHRMSNIDDTCCHLDRNILQYGVDLKWWKWERKTFQSHHCNFLNKLTYHQSMF